MSSFLEEAFVYVFLLKQSLQIENQRIVVWQVGGHVSFVPETGALLLKQVNYDDTGDYLCIVNNKREGGMTRLFVQGKLVYFSFCSQSVDDPSSEGLVTIALTMFVCSNTILYFCGHNRGDLHKLNYR